MRRSFAGAAAAGLVLALVISVPVAAGGFCRGVPVTDGTGLAVEMKNNCFTPTVLHIRPGDTVTWISRDQEAHTVSGANIAWGDYTEVRFGATVSHRFDTAGSYPYYCFLHPGMIGAVMVGDGNGPGSASSTGVAVAAPVAAQPPAERAAPPWPAVVAILILLAGAGGFGLGEVIRRRA